MKKSLSMILAVLMILSTFPLTTLAEEWKDGETELFEEVPEFPEENEAAFEEGEFVPETEPETSEEDATVYAEAKEDLLLVDPQTVASGYCGGDTTATYNADSGAYENLWWTLTDDGTLTIDGTGPMYDYNSEWNETGDIFMTTAPWGIYEKEIKKLILKEGITSIGRCAFDEMNDMAVELILPESLETIGFSAFDDCRSLTNTDLVIPDQVTQMGEWAFGYTTFDTVYLGKSAVTFINGNPFRSNNVKNFVVDKNNLNFCTIDGVLFSKDKKTLYAYPGARAESYVIPEGTVTIEAMAFENCTGDFSFPNTLEKIGFWAFSFAHLTGDLKIPSSVTVIDSSFYCCQVDGEVVIDSTSNLRIAEGSFFDMNQEAFYFTGDAPQVVPNTALQSVSTVKENPLKEASRPFSDSDALESLSLEVRTPLLKGGGHSGQPSFDPNATLYYVEGTEGWTTPTWNGYHTKAIVDFGYCGSDTNAEWNEESGAYKNLWWTLDSEGTLAIGGEGTMMGYSCESSPIEAPWYELNSSLKKLVLKEGITTIGDCAFECCTGFEGELVIPESVTSIGLHAFWQCSGFTGELVIPKNVKTIGINAFESTNLREIGFEGNAPIVKGADDRFRSFEPDAVLYYLEGKTGWTTPTWNGYKTEVWVKAELGDVNADGSINVLDANIVRRAAAKLIMLTDSQNLAADVNGDGNVDVIDANLIRRYAAKLITKFPVESEMDQVLNVHLTGNIESFDPAFTASGDDFEVIGQMIEGLFRCDASGAAVPGMAESYEISEDGLTWTFHLRDAQWANGTPVTADDFVYAWQRCLTIPAQYVDLFATAGIKNSNAIAYNGMDVSRLGVYATDDKTLIVELDFPCAFFDTLMFFPVFYPVNREFAEQCGDLYGTAPEYYLCNGPFVLDSYEPNAAAFSLKKNETYYAANDARISGINYKVIPDSAKAYLAYQNNELDVCVLSSELAKLLSDDPEFTPVMTGYLWYLSPNVKSNPDLANLNIRKAIGMAFDKNALVNNVLKGSSAVINSCVPYKLATGPDGKDYRESSNVSFCEYDVAAAQELWAKGLRELGKDKIEMTLIYDESASVKLVAEFLQSQLQTNLPGLTLNIQSYPKKQRSDLMKAHDYDIGLTRWGPDYADPLTYFCLWTDGYTHNYGEWHSDAYMELLENIEGGELAVDVEARWAAFKDLEKMIADEAVILPVYQACRASLVKSNVKGIHFHSVGLNRIYRDATIIE